jgi:hypothetical protein
MSVIITTPRPPLNLFEVVRVPVDDTSGGTMIYEVPLYRIPADGPNPQRDVRAAAILTNLIVSNTSADAATATVWVEDADGNDFTLATAADVAANSYAKLDFDKQILVTGDKLIVQMNAGNSAEVHLSFVLNQREEFEVIT